MRVGTIPNLVRCPTATLLEPLALSRAVNPQVLFRVVTHTDIQLTAARDHRHLVNTPIRIQAGCPVWPQVRTTIAALAVLHPRSHDVSAGTGPVVGSILVGVVARFQLTADSGGFAPTGMLRSNRARHHVVSRCRDFPARVAVCKNVVAAHNGLVLRGHRHATLVQSSADDPGLGYL